MIQYTLWGPYEWSAPPRPGGTGLPCHGTDFNNSVSLNTFASKAATRAVFVGHSSNDLEFVIDRTFRAGVTKLRPTGQIRPAKPFHPARVDILPMRKNNITKENLLIWQKHFLTQSHFVRCPALGLLSNSLCGPRKKKFGDPCSRARGT